MTARARAYDVDLSWEVIHSLLECTHTWVLEETPWC